VKNLVIALITGNDTNVTTLPGVSQSISDVMLGLYHGYALSDLGIENVLFEVGHFTQQQAN
jgi:hypothetical protein